MAKAAIVQATIVQDDDNDDDDDGQIASATAIAPAMKVARVERRHNTVASSFGVKESRRLRIKIPLARKPEAQAMRDSLKRLQRSLTQKGFEASSVTGGRIKRKPQAWKVKTAPSSSPAKKKTDSDSDTDSDEAGRSDTENNADFKGNSDDEDTKPPAKATGRTSGASTDEDDDDDDPGLKSAPAQPWQMLNKPRRRMLQRRVASLKKAVNTTWKAQPWWPQFDLYLVALNEYHPNTGGRRDISKRDEPQVVVFARDEAAIHRLEKALVLETIDDLNVSMLSMVHSEKEFLSELSKL